MFTNFNKTMLHRRVDRAKTILKCFYSQELENKYTKEQRQRILDVINTFDKDSLSRYALSKARLKSITQWKGSYGQLKTISDIEQVEGFSERVTKKFLDSIINDSPGAELKVNSIKGQILQPNLSEANLKDCRTVLSVYVSVNSVCWTHVDRSHYEVVQWKYHSIDYPNDGKKLLITDILDIAWKVTSKLPIADIYVMKAEATTLRAAGSDPNNPKVLAINLQKAQLVAMMVALINARCNVSKLDDETSVHKENEDPFKQRVYFLRPTLPFRLYGTLVGNERVSTDQTVETIFQDKRGSTDNSHVFIPDKLKTMFRSHKDLQQDMLGQCLLLALTFMDICIYKNQDKINKLLQRFQYAAMEKNDRDDEEIP